MITVAQKTLLLIFLTILCLFLSIFTAESRTHRRHHTNFGHINPEIFKQEHLDFKVLYKSITIGEIHLAYIPLKDTQSYKFYAKFISKGLINGLYSIDENFMSTGSIVDENLLITSKSNFINYENNHSTNKTNTYNYKNYSIELKNNKKFKDIVYFPLINNASDVFSSFYTQRFKIDLESYNNQEPIIFTSQHLNKTIHYMLEITQPYNINLKNKNQSVRDVKVYSKIIYYNPILKDKLEKSTEETGIVNINDFTINEKKSDTKFSQNMTITITNDNKKTPVMIQYDSKIGNIKAILD